MRMLLRQCDRCGFEVRYEPDSWKGPAGWKSFSLEFVPGVKDLCPGCLRRLDKFMRREPAEKEKRRGKV